MVLLLVPLTPPLKLIMSSKVQENITHFQPTISALNYIVLYNGKLFLKIDISELQACSTVGTIIIMLIITVV